VKRRRRLSGFFERLCCGHPSSVSRASRASGFDFASNWTRVSRHVEAPTEAETPSWSFAMAELAHAEPDLLAARSWQCRWGPGRPTPAAGGKIDSGMMGL